jgi:enoyl-CoA hydratase
MNSFQGKTISWEQSGGVIQLSLQHPPYNEIGTQMLEELEAFTAALVSSSGDAHALVIYSALETGFCAGADLRELYNRAYGRAEADRNAKLRQFLERIHAVFNTLDDAPLITIAAVHGLVFGGGLELALTADMIIADRMARFCFPELRLGLIPGFGGIPRLKRDVSNSVIRDLLLTGRSINADKAKDIGLISQITSEGEVLEVAHATADQVGKLDRHTAVTAKRFIKPIPRDELREEIEIFCGLFEQPAVEAGLRRFVESNDPLPYLP